MRLLKSSLPVLTLVVFLLAGLSNAWSSEPAGRVELAAGRAWLINAHNKVLRLQSGQTVYEGQSILTGSDGEVQMLMEDSGIIAVRPNTRLKIERYRARGDVEDSALLSLLKGAFRSITGWIGKYNRDRYAVKTPTATIGVRGTDHETAYLEKNNPFNQRPGTYDKVNDGSTSMVDSLGRELILAKQQAGFIGRSSQITPQRLPAIPAFYAMLPPNENLMNALKNRAEKNRDDKLQRILQQRKDRDIPLLIPDNKPPESNEPNSQGPSIKKNVDKFGAKVKRPGDLRTNSSLTPPGPPSGESSSPLQLKDNSLLPSIDPSAVGPAGQTIGNRPGSLMPHSIQGLSPNPAGKKPGGGNFRQPLGKGSEAGSGNPGQIQSLGSGQFRTPPTLPLSIPTKKPTALPEILPQHSGTPRMPLGKDKDQGQQGTTGPTNAEGGLKPLRIDQNDEGKSDSSGKSGPKLKPLNTEIPGKKKQSIDKSLQYAPPALKLKD